MYTPMSGFKLRARELLSHYFACSPNAASVRLETLQLKGLLVPILRTQFLLMALLALPIGIYSQTYGAGVDAYFGDWHTAPVYTIYGALQAQDVLTRGDAFHPTAKGAVLRFASSFRHAILAPRTVTSIIKLESKQQIVYVESGTGEVLPHTGAALPISAGSALLIPVGTEMVLRNTASIPLTFYVIEESTQPGFKPRDGILLRDSGSLPFTATGEQWSYMVKPIFSSADGLATLTRVSIIEMGAMTIGRPASTRSADSEIVWTTLKGSPIAFVANELRRQPPGTAFLEVPDGKTPHSAVDPNQSESVSFLVYAHD